MSGKENASLARILGEAPEGYQEARTQDRVSGQGGTGWSGWENSNTTITTTFMTDIVCLELNTSNYAEDAIPPEFMTGNDGNTAKPVLLIAEYISVLAIGPKQRTANCKRYPNISLYGDG